MGMVKVWNDNVHPYKEQFRDQLIQIPPKKFILMEAGDAHLFKGTFAPIKLDADENPIPEGYKMIRIEESGADVIEMPKVNELLCQACKYEGSSAGDLSEHIKSTHKDVAAVDEEAEQEIKKRKAARKA